MTEFDPIPRAPFVTVAADPAWLFGDSLPGPGRGASKHYRCLSLAELCTLRLPPIADDAWLYLWRVGSMQADALAVGRAWGFGEPTSEIVWVKTKGDTRRPTASARIGMGRTVRNAHEICLIFKRGKPERLDAGVSSLIFAPRLEHSRKPAEFYAAVERLSAGPRLELFAREPRPGWTTVGSELGQVLR